jgi:hypothetical protein
MGGKADPLFGMDPGERRAGLGPARYTTSERAGSPRPTGAQTVRFAPVPYTLGQQLPATRADGDTLTLAWAAAPARAPIEPTLRRGGI